ncbi:Alpha/Beta hydrolase protein [Podospora australis]|uniref:Carboxylic ester hydrolase n=1 Tax=Podospora australis TaxID=1536484 RepID=A0AAN7AM08_9PEZI|nr:Alpha/Beta hydrolase protein [Podospora australis]
MWSIRFLLPFFLLLTAVLAAEDQTTLTSKKNLTIKATTGIYTGLIDPDFPNVRQFRSIAYAEPPIGKHRWLPPVPVGPSLRRSFAYRFPPSCPQYLTKNLTTWNSNITDFAIGVYGQSLTAGAMAQASSEDCLYLAIWTPTNATADSNLPVALFLPGGDFVSGGVDVTYQKPTPWVQRTQSHIVVTANYRVNIAGFPWAAGLEEQNVGIMDQRAALEWVYANIGFFGGDNSRITLWGHSAGGVAVDIVSHAYHDNPLIAGMFMQSGTAMVNISYPDHSYGNFTFVAKNLGCDFPEDKIAEVDCMRHVPMTLIQNFMGQYRDNNTKPALSLFKPVPDEKRVFFNYTLRAQKGLSPKVPALVSTTSNESATLSRYPLTNVTEGPYQPSVDAATVGVFVCLASNTTVSRQKNSLTTYRYEYAGNFSSITPLSWMGAYHASDVPMIFGTYARKQGVTDLQRKVAETMQDYILAFLEDPENGLKKKGWLPYGEGEGQKNMLRFASGPGSQSIERNVSAAEVDDACVLGKTHVFNP